MDGNNGKNPPTPLSTEALLKLIVNIVQAEHDKNEVRAKKALTVLHYRDRQLAKLNCQVDQLLHSSRKVKEVIVMPSLNLSSLSLTDDEDPSPSKTRYDDKARNIACYRQSAELRAADAVKNIHEEEEERNILETASTIEGTSEEFASYRLSSTDDVSHADVIIETHRDADNQEAFEYVVPSPDADYNNVGLIKNKENLTDSCINLIRELQKSNNLLRSAIKEQEDMKIMKDNSNNYILNKIVANLLKLKTIETDKENAQLSPENAVSKQSQISNKQIILEILENTKNFAGKLIQQMTINDESENQDLRNDETQINSGFEAAFETIQENHKSLKKNQIKPITMLQYTETDESPIKIEMRSKKKHEIAVQTEDLFEEIPPQWLISEALGFKNEKIKHEPKIDTTSNDIIQNLTEKLEQANEKIQEILEQKDELVNQHNREMEKCRIFTNKIQALYEKKIAKLCDFVIKKMDIQGVLNDMKNTTKNKKIKLTIKPVEKSGSLSKCFNQQIKKMKFQNNLNETREVIETKLADVKEQLKSMQNQLTEMNKKNENLMNKFQDTINTNCAINNAIDKVEKQVDNGKLQGLQVRMRNLDQQLITQSRTITTLKKEITENKKVIDNLKNRLYRSDAMCHNKQILLENYKIKISEMEAAQTDNVKNCPMYIADTEKLKKCAADWKDRTYVLTKELEQVIIENEKLNRELKFTKQSLQQNEKTIEKLTMENKDHENLFKALQEHDAKVKQLTLKVDETKHIIKQYENTIEELLRLLENRSSKENVNEFTRHAHEKACSILNLTPRELQQLFECKSSRDDNTIFKKWLRECKQITSETEFSQNLVKFLYEIINNTSSENK